MKAFFATLIMGFLIFSSAIAHERFYPIQLWHGGNSGDYGWGARYVHHHGKDWTIHDPHMWKDLGPGSGYPRGAYYPTNSLEYVVPRYYVNEPYYYYYYVPVSPSEYYDIYYNYQSGE